MNNHVDVTFDCIPLRSIERWDIPMDASPDFEDLCDEIRQAAKRHGRHNSYYLHHGRCVFHLTNDDQQGLLDFVFRGTVLTDPKDHRTLVHDLKIEFAGDICDWLTSPVVAWFAETVQRAVRVEFDRYIASGDLERTAQRLELIQAEMCAGCGFSRFSITP
jgi:hypothetical protein